MVEELRRRPRAVAVALLVLVAVAWGSTFVVVQRAIVHTPVLDFLGWRFLLAGLLLVAVRPRAVTRLGWRGWGRGTALGVVLGAGYVAQTFGLRSTPAAVSGFLTGLQVVFTPLLAWAVLRQRPASRTWAAALVATSGLTILCLRGVAFGVGEDLTVASAALFALQIVVLGRWVSEEDAFGLTAVQLLTIGAMSLLAAAPKGIVLPASGEAWAAVAVTAVAATAFAFVVQSWAQSHLSTTAVAVVFTTEPVFAALFAWLSGERLGWAVLVGGTLVVLAMLVLGPETRRKEPPLVARVPGPDPETRRKEPPLVARVPGPPPGYRSDGLAQGAEVRAPSQDEVARAGRRAP